MRLPSEAFEASVSAIPPPGRAGAATFYQGAACACVRGTRRWGMTFDAGARIGAAPRGRRENEMGKDRSACAWLLVIGAITVVLALPATAGARVKAAAVSAQSNPTYAIDGWELWGGDDTKTTARDMTAKFTAFGNAPYTENHTLDKAPTSGVVCDQDWYKFQVTANDIIDRRGFLIEAYSSDQFCDPVIELYGPGSSFVPSMTPAWNPAPAYSGDPAALMYQDDGPWMHRGSSLSFMPYEVTTTPGWYYFRVRPYSTGGGYGGRGGPYTLRLKRGLLERIFGADRVATAVKISQERWRSWAPTASLHRVVVIANKDNFPDGLAGSVLCGFGSGPLLLTAQSYLPSSVRAEVARIGAQHVYVLGGTGAVSDGVFSALQSISPTITVVRLAGDTRIQTAMEVALQSRIDVGHLASWYATPTVAIIVNSDAWPDALAASPLAAYANVPILLTPATYLHPDSAEALVHLGTKNVVIVGGTGVVSPAVEASLVAQMGGADHVLRIAGANRYETAKEFAVWAADVKGPGARGDGKVGTTATSTVSALTSISVGVASGENFPDALAGGAMCGSNWPGSPLLLTPKNPVDALSYIFESYELALPPGDTDYFSDIGGGHVAIESSRLFGGAGAVSDAMFMQLDQDFGFTGP